MELIKSKKVEGVDQLLTPDRTAEILGLKNKRTLEVWRSTKRYDLRWIKVGGLVMYRAKDIQAFIESRLEGGE